MKKFNLTLLLTMLVSMNSTKALAYDVAVENENGITIYYNYINDGTEFEVTFYSSSGSYSGDVKIPETVTIQNRTRKVTSIGYKAFYDCRGLTSVAIPSSVTSIGSYAFDYCSGLKKVIVKDLAAWCRISFDSSGNSNPLYYAHHLYSDENTEITDLVIPDGVTSIEMAFVGCTGLTSVTIPDGVTSIEGAFIGCTGLTSVTIPASVTNIVGAFMDCTGLTSVTIPDGVTSIGATFFGCTGLTSVTIPASVTSIGQWAFHDCSGLKKVIVKDLTAWCSISFIGISSGDSNPLYYAHHLYSDEDTEITDLVIPDGVTSIGSYAFEHCSGLTSVTIPDGVTSIGRYAFNRCIGLSSVIIPASVKSIGDYAFYDCYDLADVVSLIQEPFRVSKFVSDIVYKNATLYVPQGTIEKYKATDGWKQFVWIEEGMPAGIKLPNGAASNATEVQRYTIDGEGINSPQHGINIVKMSDGTTKKVIVK